jgi:hypothetical protein
MLTLARRGSKTKVLAVSISLWSEERQEVALARIDRRNRLG